VLPQTVSIEKFIEVTDTANPPRIIGLCGFYLVPKILICAQENIPEPIGV
jgi:hypothetical protein